MTTKIEQQESTEVVERLREWLHPGDTIYCILRHVARSGMLRVIDLVKIKDDQVLSIGWNAAKALGMKYDRDREGIRIGGVGMDMGFALVYDLSRVLFSDGYICIGERCPANDHSNPPYPDRDGKMQHNDGGYALHHKWL